MEKGKELTHRVITGHKGYELYKKAMIAELNRLTIKGHYEPIIGVDGTTSFVWIDDKIK